MAAKYTIVDTQPTVYQDAVKGIVNGVLIRFTLTDYDEVHEIRLPDMNVKSVQAAIEKVLASRDALAALGQIE